MSTEQWIPEERDETGGDTAARKWHSLGRRDSEESKGLLRIHPYTDFWNHGQESEISNVGACPSVSPWLHMHDCTRFAAWGTRWWLLYLPRNSLTKETHTSLCLDLHLHVYHPTLKAIDQKSHFRESGEHTFEKMAWAGRKLSNPLISTECFWFVK